MEQSLPWQHELIERYERMLGRLGVSPDHHPLHWTAQNDGGSHVEPDGSGWALVVTDRGRELSRWVFGDLDQLLYRLACNIVAVEGGRRQAASQTGGRDPRRADFAHRLDLIGRVSPEWQRRLSEELAQWLARHPYRDLPGPPEKERGTNRRNEWIGLGIVAVLVLGWGAAHFPLWSTWEQQQRLERDGFGIRAEITGRHVTKGRFADSYTLDYRFQGPNRQMDGHDNVDWQTFQRVRPEGSRIEVLYDPAQPETNMVAGNDPAGRLLWIYAVIDVLLLSVIGRGIILSRRAAAKG